VILFPVPGCSCILQLSACYAHNVEYKEIRGNPGTPENWEQRREHPMPPALVQLGTANRVPDCLMRGATLMPDDRRKRRRIGLASVLPGQIKRNIRRSASRKDASWGQVGFSPEAVGRELMHVVSKNRNGGPGRKRRAF
jgi:hypothetical protein